jgi:erythromycin esterase-like protein
MINDYIHFKNDCLDSLFRGDLWIQDNETVRQFIFWMREFNKGREEQDQLCFIGIDNQVDALMLDEVLQQVADYIPGLEWDRELFIYNLPGKKRVRYEDMNEEEYSAIRHAILQLKNQVKSYTLSLTNPQAIDSAGVALQLIRSLQGSHEFLYLIYAWGENIRDRQMAGNVMRILEGADEAPRVAVWAHNAHVACNPHYYSDGFPAMGWYLRDSLGGAYLSVATSFSVGRFTAVMLDSLGNDTPPMTCQINQDPPEGSVNDLFHQARYQQFFLDIRDLDTATAIFRYLDSPRPMIGVGDLYLGSPERHFTEDRILNLAKAHDLLFYYTGTRPML